MFLNYAQLFQYSTCTLFYELSWTSPIKLRTHYYLGMEFLPLVLVTWSIHRKVSTVEAANDIKVKFNRAYNKVSVLEFSLH